MLEVKMCATIKKCMCRGKEAYGAGAGAARAVQNAAGPDFGCRCRLELSACAGGWHAGHCLTVASRAAVHGHRVAVGVEAGGGVAVLLRHVINSLATLACRINWFLCVSLQEIDAMMCPTRRRFIHAARTRKMGSEFHGRRGTCLRVGAPGSCGSCYSGNRRFGPRRAVPHVPPLFLREGGRRARRWLVGCDSILFSGSSNCYRRGADYAYACRLRHETWKGGDLFNSPFCYYENILGA